MRDLYVKAPGPSAITVNSEPYTDLKATDALNIPIVDTNGDAVDTTIDGGNVVVDDLPCAAPTDEWVRPADWLTMPSLTSADDKIALLHAVWDNDSNFVALQCSTSSGDYQVDWGDGTVTTHASNTVAEHQYNYSTYDTSNSTLSTRGYKQAIIVITPLIGGLTTFTTNIRHSTQNQVYSTGYLDVLLSMPNATTGNSITFNTNLVSNRYLERVEILSVGNLTSMSGMFFNCRVLQSVTLFDTSSVENMNLMFFNCTALQSAPLFDTSSVTSMSRMFENCRTLQSVPLFDTSSVSNMAQMFFNCSALQSVTLFDTSSVTIMSRMFEGCNSLESVPLFDTSIVTSMARMFLNCSALQSVPFFDTSSVTTMSEMFVNCQALQSAPPFDTSSVTNMTNIFNNCNSLSKTDIVCVASVSFANNQLSRDGIVNIFNNLIDLTGSSSQNINISGNYGVADLTPSDLQIATNKNWTVTT